MARKKYVGKPCAYCGKDGISETRDHVVAKEFFLEEDRANLPLVPACGICNGEKSKQLSTWHECAVV
jgi:5-methylcytosine-specific restriction endonuclease McrA